MASMADQRIALHQEASGAPHNSFDCEATAASAQSSNEQSPHKRCTICYSITVALGVAVGMLAFAVLEPLVTNRMMAGDEVISFDADCIREYLGAHGGRVEMFEDCEVTNHGLGMVLAKAFAKPAVALRSSSHGIAATKSLVPASNPTIARFSAPTMDGAWDRSKMPGVVSDVREAFYAAYGKPYVPNSVAGFVSEMLSLNTMAMVSPQFEYSRVFAVGFESLTKYFLQPLDTDEERVKMRAAMCTALALDSEQIKKDAEAVTGMAEGSTEEKFLSGEDFTKIAETPDYKYTYTLGAGLLALMPMVGEEPSNSVIERWCEKLKISTNRLQKDWAYYQSVVRKMDEFKEMMLQMQVSEKKKKAVALKEAADRAAAEAAAAEAKETGAAAPAPAEAEAAPAEQVDTAGPSGKI